MTHRTGPKPHPEGKHWNGAEIQQMKKLAKGNTPTGLIADKLGRTEDAIYSEASEQDITLKSTNKPPYNRRKK